MILQADIGIGLFGKEGNRAVDSSDFAIGEFKHLWVLLFKHGRWNYKRMAMMINWYFYKNFLYTLMQLFFSFCNGFSMQTVFPDLFLTMYNLQFSAWPIMFYALFEKDVCTNIDGIRFKQFIPSLYFVGQRNLAFNPFVYLVWSIVGFLQTLVLFIVPY